MKSLFLQCRPFGWLVGRSVTCYLLLRRFWGCLSITSLAHLLATTSAVQLGLSERVCSNSGTLVRQLIGLSVCRQIEVEIKTVRKLLKRQLLSKNDLCTKDCLHTTSEPKLRTTATIDISVWFFSNSTKGNNSTPRRKMIIQICKKILVVQ